MASASAEDKDSVSSFEHVNLPSGDEIESSPSSELDASTQPPPPPEITPAAIATNIQEQAEEILPAEGGDDGEYYSKPGPSSTSPNSRSIDPVVRELEEAAAVAAAATAEAAAVAKDKIMKGAAGAKAFMSSLWSAFDDSSTAAAREEQSEKDLRQRLGLEENEAILGRIYTI